jgi:hypothetical protein
VLENNISYRIIAVLKRAGKIINWVQEAGEIYG